MENKQFKRALDEHIENPDYESNPQREKELKNLNDDELRQLRKDIILILRERKEERQLKGK